jgi:hypothetical protein
MAFELRPRNAERLSRPGAVLLAVTAALYAVLLPARQLTPTAYARAVAENYPVDAVKFIHAAHLQGPMWNEFQWGGYLIGELPEIPVFVDGRTELYGDDFLYQYQAVVSGKADPEPLLDRYFINFALVKVDSLIAAELKSSGCWREAYSDEVAAVLTRGTC